MSLPTVSIVTVLDDWSQFNILLNNHWNSLDYPKDKLEWIIVSDSVNDYSGDIPGDENILYFQLKSEEYLEKITFKNDENELIQNYFKKTGKLPSGFKRDYAVGITSNEYIFHLDVDCIYTPKVIRKKLKFLKDNKLECCYCKAMLAYDIYGKGLYKVDNKVAGYESTLFHSREFWVKGGFKWEDIVSEALSFYYGKGLDRAMENFYDTVKLLSLHNHTKYQPIKIELKNYNVEIPDIVSKLDVSEHPILLEINNVFRENINVLGIQSELLTVFKNDKWSIQNIEENNKLKEKPLIKQIKGFEKDFSLCFINTKNPIWTIFKNIHFDCIMLESSKNREQMDHILKENNFVVFDNLYFNKSFLLNN